MPIVVIGIVSQIATGLIALANKAFDLKADSSIQVILIVVLYGIGTDYILFFLFRYRERLREGEPSKGAVVAAVERAGEAIASAGGAVIVAFLALVLSSLELFRSIGPALAIAVAMTLLAALTLVPAVVSLLGTRVFWPSKAWRDEPTARPVRGHRRPPGSPPGPLRGRLRRRARGARRVRRSRSRPTFDLSDAGVPKTAESTKALATLRKGLPAGATDPTTVLLHATDGKRCPQAQLTGFARGARRRARGRAGRRPRRSRRTSRPPPSASCLADDPSSDAASPT